MRKKGMIQVYTGDGKGKTTAAVGLAVRANAHGLKVCYISFHKDPKYYNGGEQKNLKKLGINVRCFAKAHPMCKGSRKTTRKELTKKCHKGLEYIRNIFRRNVYDVLIADEINICVRDGYLSEQELLDILNEKPQQMEFVMTGRQATKKMIKKADMVSFIKEIKHPYKKGFISRKGIEY